MKQPNGMIFVVKKSNNFDEYHKESINYNEIQTQILDDYTLQMGNGQAIKTEFYSFHKKYAHKMMIIFKAYDVMRLDRYKYHDYKKNTYVLIVETSTSKDLVAESTVNDILLDCKEHIKEDEPDEIYETKKKVVENNYNRNLKHITIQCQRPYPSIDLLDTYCHDNNIHFEKDIKKYIHQKLTSII